MPLQIAHPVWMLAFLVLTSVTFSLFGFIIGIWADGFEKLQIVPLLIITPLTFLGGSFYSIHMLPPFWQTVTLFNPVVYLISGFRWSFYELADVQRRRQPGDDRRRSSPHASSSSVDFQDRLSVENLKTAYWPPNHQIRPLGSPPLRFLGLRADRDKDIKLPRPIEPAECNPRAHHHPILSHPSPPYHPPSSPSTFLTNPLQYSHFFRLPATPLPPPPPLPDT